MVEEINKQKTHKIDIKVKTQKQKRFMSEILTYQ